jgi:leucyl aminopeptidase
VLSHLTDKIEDGTVIVTPLRKDQLEEWLSGQAAGLRQWVESTQFVAAAGQISLIAGGRGRLRRVLFGIGDGGDPWVFAHLPAKLPAAVYRLDGPLEAEQATWAAIAWSLATYRFDRYKADKDDEWPVLVWPEGCDRPAVERVTAATALVRDLINVPAGDMGPGELAGVAETMAGHHGAECRVLVGEELLLENWPAIHAVGRASSRPPRLIDLTWGDPAAPKVSIVGKGVCFDSGGLDIKPASAMKLMKKDMGGAAHALGLAKMIMMANLPVRLRVLIPAVENAVSGSAFRPLDVLRTRKGLTVEVGNTDAEGRLILCDALFEADREKPALLIDLATLTGAARSAVGTEIAALFCNDDELAADLYRHSVAQHDPVWRLPLWSGYRRILDSKVADINNCGDSPYAGAITAALFLKEFVSPETLWAHFDFMAWNTSSQPGRPEGGEAQALRALFATIAERFGGEGSDG